MDTGFPYRGHDHLHFGPPPGWGPPMGAVRVNADVALEGYAVMLCGQLRFVADLSRQFRALGVPRERIITEELEFR